MDLTKKKTPLQISAVAKCTNSKKGAENLPRRSREPVNDWAILDEIEAPMWADLTLECDPTYDDNDDEWFLVSHPFHQCSARKLKSTYHSSALDVLVSESGGSEKEIKNDACDGKAYDRLNHIPSSCSDKKKVIEASSSQPFGYTSGLLSNLRNSLRKSYVTRQASMVEIKGVNSMVTENADKVPNCEKLPTNKVNRVNVQKAPAAQAKNMSCKSDLHINGVASKKMDRKKQAEGYVTREVNNQVPLATAKNFTRAINSSRSVHGGKENQSGKTALAMKPSMRMNDAEGPLQNLKAVKKNVHQTSNGNRLAGERENYNCGNEVKKSMGLVKTIYF